MQFYNNERRHSSLQYLTPAQYYIGNPDELLKTRKIKIEMARMIRMRAKYLSIVRRLGKNSAIVAIARILLECIYVMITKNIEFEDNIDSLTERKMKAMSMRAKNPRRFKDIEEVEKNIYEEERSA